jgi:O-antigen/teichoic acid export membrane protein
MLPAGPLCQAFFIIFSLAFLSTPLSMAFYVLERPWYSFGLYVVNSVINVGLDLILIPRYGLVGAIIPVALVILISPFSNYFLLRRLGVRAPIPWGFLARVYLAAIPCALLFPARYFVSGKLPLALVALGAGILYIAGLRLFRVLGDEEGALLRRSGLPMASRLGRLLGLKDS